MSSVAMWEDPAVECTCSFVVTESLCGNCIRREWNYNCDCAFTCDRCGMCDKCHSAVIHAFNGLKLCTHCYHACR